MDPTLIMVIAGLALILSALVAGAICFRQRLSENRRLERRCRDLKCEGKRESK